MTDPTEATDVPRSVPPRLRVGFVPGVTLSKWRRIWGERFPRNTLEMVGVHPAEQRAVLDDARVDMCFVRLPIDRAGLHVIPLYEELPVVMVARDHPVALFEAVTLTDLADEPVIDVNHPDAVDLVVCGAGVLLVPQSVARTHSRRDLVHRPVSDGTPTTIALAWSVDHPSDLIEDFIGVVRGRTVNSSRAKSGPGPDAAPSRPAKTAGAGRPARRRGTRPRGR